MKNILQPFLVLLCALTLSACESMNAAWDSTKGTLSNAFASPASSAAITPAVALNDDASSDEAPNDDGAIQPVRSEAPLSEIEIADQSYADEATNHGTPPVSALIPVNYHAPTPTTLAGGKLITTFQLHKLLTGKKPPLLINALSGDLTELIPGSIWLSGAGEKGKFNDETQQHLGQRLEELTGGDRKQMLVFYCSALTCWRSYNASLRAVNLGYRNVHWYRGGLTSWYAAGLPSVQSSDNQW